MASSGQVETYPSDCYSFIAIHSPFVEPLFFALGLVVFLFQMMFLGLMVISIVIPKFREAEVDNPDLGDTFPGKFFPSNVSTQANITQATAFLSYCIFSDSSLQDMVKAVEQFPRLDRIRGDDRPFLVIFSCLLRFIQGLSATLVTMLLILTTPNVVEIILNFAAVNYISNLDEAAFTLAKQGKYGPRLEEEAKSIEKRVVPYSLYREYSYKRYAYSVLLISIVMLAIFVAVLCTQLSPKYWLTQELRVEFRDPALHPYSGCYDLSDISHDRRKNYNGHGYNEEPAVFGYCPEEQHWLLYTPEDSYTTPCNATPKNQHVMSAETDAFDIGSSFGEPWFTATGKPLDLYFTKEGEELNCGDFLYDGNCDTVFNDVDHFYDGGDCCASTCSKTNCGIGGVTTTFGVKERLGNGYPNCKDKDMFFPVTILLTSIVSSRNETFLDVTDDQVEDYRRERGIDFRTEPPNLASLIVECNDANNPKKVNYLWVYIENNSTDSMENQTETVWVPQGAQCEVRVRNRIEPENYWDISPIWFANYTIFHGEGRVNKIISGDSSKYGSTTFRRIPECYFDKLKGFVNLASAYAFDDPETKALKWLVEDSDESGHSKCDDNFLIERAALSAINFAAPISKADTIRTADTLWINAQQQCGWNNIICNANGNVTALSIKSMNLTGTISAAIGLLPGLQRLNYDNNYLSGTIPSEFGSLKELRILDIDNNMLSGSIPTELGNLVNLFELDLDNNKLSGTIPTEFGLLIDLRELDIQFNLFSGTLPTEIGNLSSIATLWAHDNIMTGSLPSQLGKLSKLEQLQLNDNRFTGSIPTEVGTMINMREFDLTSNSISGTVPTEIGNLSDMTNLSLTNNSMTGSLPTQLGELINLEHLHLRDNDFTGSIPTEIGSMKSLSCINLRGNSLRGPIPSEIGLMTNLIEIMLEGNDFTGTIPVEVASLVRLQMLTFGGSLTGDIPGNVRTLVPCVLCSGTTYKLKNISDNSPDPSASNCRMLLEKQQDTEMPFSGNECEELKDSCIDCTVPENLFAEYGPSP